MHLSWHSDTSNGRRLIHWPIGRARVWVHRIVLQIHHINYSTISVLWRCWLGGRKGIRPAKKWVVRCWCGCLGWDADLHIAQQTPLPLTISCSSKSRLVLSFRVLPFWYLLTRVVPDIFQKSSKTVVCVCVITVLFHCQKHGHSHQVVYFLSFIHSTDRRHYSSNGHILSSLIVWKCWSSLGLDYVPYHG